MWWGQSATVVVCLSVCACVCVFELKNYTAQWFPFKFPFGPLTMSPLTTTVPGGAPQQHLVHLGGQRCFNSLSTLSQATQGLRAHLVSTTQGSSVLVVGRQPVLQMKDAVNQSFWVIQGCSVQSITYQQKWNPWSQQILFFLSFPFSCAAD